LEISVVGFSNCQPIRQSCLSGYVSCRDIHKELVVEVEVAEQFEGDAVLTISLVTDCDDGFYSATELEVVGPFTADMLSRHHVWHFQHFRSQLERFVCLHYGVENGSFTKGRLTARLVESKEELLTVE